MLRWGGGDRPHLDGQLILWQFQRVSRLRQETDDTGSQVLLSDWLPWSRGPEGAGEEGPPGSLPERPLKGLVGICGSCVKIEQVCGHRAQESDKAEELSGHLVGGWKSGEASLPPLRPWVRNLSPCPLMEDSVLSLEAWLAVLGGNGWREGGILNRSRG